MNHDEDKFKLALFSIIWFCVIFFIIFLSMQFCDEGERFSRIGDAFNILNTLFAGLAFAAIYFQLRMQQKQINEERQDRHRADRISALSTRIQVTFDKILLERELLIKVAPSFSEISFLHEEDGAKIKRMSVHQKEKNVMTDSLESRFPEESSTAIEPNLGNIAVPVLAIE
jgi:hypothetical protein